MNTTTKMIVVLSAAAVIMGGVLSGFYHMVHPKIEANRLEEERNAVFKVLDGIKSYEVIEREVPSGKKVEKLRIFKGLDEGGNAVGYAFIAKGPGFAGTITMMVGLNSDMKTLSNMQVLEQVETPGLGNKIVEDKFTGQFKGLSIEPKIEYLKNKRPEKPNQIQAITGATISSKAVTEAINKDAARVIGILKEGETSGGQE